MIPRLGMVKNLKFGPTISVRLKILKILILLFQGAEWSELNILKRLSILTFAYFDDSQVLTLVKISIFGPQFQRG